MLPSPFVSAQGAQHERPAMSADNIIVASVSPTEVLAGDSAEFVITVTVGEGYTEGESRLIFDLPATVSMSRPTTLHQEESGYVVAYVANPEVTYQLRVWDMEILDFPTKTKTSWRGMAARMAVLDLGPGCKAGDTLRVHWGDTGGGYGGATKVTHVVPIPDYRAKVHVRYFDGHDQGLPDLGRSFEGYDRPEPEAEVELSFGVSPRPPHHVRLLRRQDHALLLPLDVYSNVAETTSPADVVIGADDAPKNEFHAYRAPLNVQVKPKSVPLTQSAPMRDVHDGYNLYWGDIHSHSAFSNDCIEREKLQMAPGDLMRSARDRAGLDFYATTDHHQPWDQQRNRIGRDYWEQTLEAVKKYHARGEFIVFPGIEYRCMRGDTAVVFGWDPTYDEIDREEWTDVRKVWQGLKGRSYLSIAHFHNLGGLDEGAWWEDCESGVEPVLEIFSCHGSYEREDALEHHIPMAKRSRFDRYGLWMLQQGLHYGLVANSDGHKGHVGLNGVTAVFARDLSRESLIEAYRSRRVYATTNARIRLVFTANGQLMGSRIAQTTDKQFTIDVIGEDALKKVELFHGTERHALLIPKPGSRSFKTELSVEDPEPGFWYVRATQVDNHVAWSSPVWFGEQ